MSLIETGKINALVIGGAGIAGTRHVEARNRIGGATTIIFDENLAKARTVGEDLGVGVATTGPTLDRALREADIVHVCTPDHLHTDYILSALQSGSHVFVEKPMTTNLSDALKVQNAANTYQKEAAVGTGYRLTPTFSEVKRLVSNHELGDILSLETTYLHDMRGPIAQTPWRLNQDFLYGGGIHAIDLAYWMLGEDIEEVQASVGKKRIPDYKSSEDYTINLRSKSGIIARIWLNALAQLPNHGTDLKVYGTDGTYITQNRMEGYSHYDTRNGQKENEFVQLQNKGVLTVDLQIRILDQWLKGEREDYSPIPNVNEAVEVMRILDAVDHSIASGKTEKVLHNA